MMYIVLILLFVVIGMSMLLKPQIVFDITESWKSCSSSEPSRLYLFSTRFGGVMFLLIGVAGVVVSSLL